eukprot:COSAG03_NODE_2512_length_2685_cov_6.684841_3_plen_299_part_00
MEQVLEAELATIANKANELAGLRARERQSQNNLAALGARIAAMQAEDDADSADMARLRNSIRFNEADRREKSTGFERLQRCHDVGVGAEAAQQAFLEYTAEHYLASANLEAKLHGLSNRMQDLQDGLNARCEQIKALEQLQESMKVNLKSHMADCTRTHAHTHRERERERERETWLGERARRARGARARGARGGRAWLSWMTRDPQRARLPSFPVPKTTCWLRCRRATVTPRQVMANRAATLAAATCAALLYTADGTLAAAPKPHVSLPACLAMSVRPSDRRPSLPPPPPPPLLCVCV